MILRSYPTVPCIHHKLHTQKLLSTIPKIRHLHTHLSERTLSREERRERAAGEEDEPTGERQLGNGREDKRQGYRDIAGRMGGVPFVEPFADLARGSGDVAHRERVVERACLAQFVEQRPPMCVDDAQPYLREPSLELPRCRGSLAVAFPVGHPDSLGDELVGVRDSLKHDATRSGPRDLRTEMFEESLSARSTCTKCNACQRSEGLGNQIDGPFGYD